MRKCIANFAMRRYLSNIIISLLLVSFTNADRSFDEVVIKIDIDVEHRNRSSIDETNISPQKQHDDDHSVSTTEWTTVVDLFMPLIGNIVNSIKNQLGIFDDDTSLTTPITYTRKHVDEVKTDSINDIFEPPHYETISDFTTPNKNLIHRAAGDARVTPSTRLNHSISKKNDDARPLSFCGNRDDKNPIIIPMRPNYYFRHFFTRPIDHDVPAPVAPIERSDKIRNTPIGYSWKYVCFQNADVIRPYSFNRDKITLPKKPKVDMNVYYRTYIVRTISKIDRSISPLNRRYNGGYLKRKYTKFDNITRTNTHKYASLTRQRPRLRAIYWYEWTGARGENLFDRPCPCAKNSSTSIPNSNFNRTLTCITCPRIVSELVRTKRRSPYCSYLPFSNSCIDYCSSARTTPNTRITTSTKNLFAPIKTNITITNTGDDLLGPAGRNITRSMFKTNFESHRRLKRYRRFVYFHQSPYLYDLTLRGDNCTRGNTRWCNDGHTCIPIDSWCNGKIDCNDRSDETNCSCKERIHQEKLCDGYFDCPDGSDEEGCFGCPIDKFSCNDRSSWKPRSTCVSMSQRCDNRPDCDNQKDERDCEILIETVSSHKTFFTSYTSGYLHRNWKGKWYPVCNITGNNWDKKACEAELGSPVKSTIIDLRPFYNEYNGTFIKQDGDKVKFETKCPNPGYAIHVNCPPLECGTRLPQDDFRSNYRSKRHVVETDVDYNIPSILPAPSITGRIVGGDFSYPGRWPWLVAIYKDGKFHCGGVIIDETWIASAAHCFYRYESYFEVQVGTLRRLSYSPSEQIRRISHFVTHPKFKMQYYGNDIALAKLDKPLKFNRWVRPACLPEPRPPWGPTPGTICKAVGWGSTIERGLVIDSLKEVDMPVHPKCQLPRSRNGGELCAGYLNGGQDSCHGDSGGPLLCKIPHSDDRWYVGGLISHGEGCARPNKPGSYTRVASFVPWILANTDDKLIDSMKKTKKECPGKTCLRNRKCIPLDQTCDRYMDCFDAEDEANCTKGMTIFEKNDIDVKDLFPIVINKTDAV